MHSSPLLPRGEGKVTTWTMCNFIALTHIERNNLLPSDPIECNLQLEIKHLAIAPLCHPQMYSYIKNICAANKYLFQYIWAFSKLKQ